MKEDILIWLTAFLSALILGAAPVLLGDAEEPTNPAAIQYQELLEHSALKKAGYPAPHTPRAAAQQCPPSNP